MGDRICGGSMMALQRVTEEMYHELEAEVERLRKHNRNLSDACSPTCPMVVAEVERLKKRLWASGADQWDDA